MSTRKPEKLFIFGSVFFVPNEKLLVESLFQSPVTASGIYKVRKNGILFLSGNGNPFAFLVANKYNERFFVSCCNNENPKGIRYLFGLMESDKIKLGLEGIGYKNELEIASGVWDSISKAEGNA